MRLFIFSLDGDGMDWFIELPANNFDSLESIINAFEEKYGDGRRIKMKVKANYKNIIKELTQMIKDMKFNQDQLIKNIELNQTRLIADHAKEMSTMEVKHSS